MVAPVKPASTPRMEFLAAMMGGGLAKRIWNHRELGIDISTYWSVSQTVLQWLTMAPRKFQPFVLHRVGEQRRCIPTMEKAPYASRCIKGPQVFRQSEDKWPHQDFVLIKIPTHLRILILQWPIFRTGYVSKSYIAVSTFILFIQRQQAKCAEKSVSHISMEITALQHHSAMDKSTPLFAMNLPRRRRHSTCKEEQIAWNQKKMQSYCQKSAGFLILIVKYNHEKSYQMLHKAHLT